MNRRANGQGQGSAAGRVFVFVMLVSLLSAAMVRAARTVHDLPRLFAAGRYDEAVAVADSLAGAGDRGTELLWWRYRLATHPDAARRLALELLDRQDLALARRQDLLLDQARQALATGDPSLCLDMLDLLHDTGTALSPGHGLLAGLAHVAAGDREAARDALAAVTPGEADFCWARWLLGDLAREEGDLALARHYWESVTRHGRPPCTPEILASLHELERLADPAAADRLASRLRRDHPGSLALLRLPPPAVPAVAPPAAAEDRGPAVESRPTVAGVAVQLAAFRDRGRAIAFRHRWAPELGALRLVTGRDEAGDVVYRVRSPLFADRREAAETARLWRERFGLAPIIVNEQP